MTAAAGPCAPSAGVCPFSFVPTIDRIPLFPPVHARAGDHPPTLWQDGYAAIHFAAMEGHEQVMRLILSTSAKIDITNRVGAPAPLLPRRNATRHTTSHLGELIRARACVCPVFSVYLCARVAATAAALTVGRNRCDDGNVLELSQDTQDAAAGWSGCGGDGVGAWGPPLRQCGGVARGGPRQHCWQY